MGRAEVLAALFFLLAFWFGRLQSMSGSRSRSNAVRWRAIISVGAAALFYLLGLFSKETAVTLPAVLLVYDWIHREEFLVSPGKKKPVEAPTLGLVVSRYIVFGIIVLIHFAFRKHAVTAPSNIWVGFVGVFAAQLDARQVWKFSLTWSTRSQESTGSVPTTCSTSRDSSGCWRRRVL